MSWRWVLLLPLLYCLQSTWRTILNRSLVDSVLYAADLKDGMVLQTRDPDTTLKITVDA